MIEFFNSPFSYETDFGLELFDPKAVKIAVFVDFKDFFSIGKDKVCNRRRSGLKVLSVDLFVCDKGDESDMMSFCHRMNCASDFDMNLIAVDSNDRNMFF